jgi:hypothetical protein
MFSGIVVESKGSMKQNKLIILSIISLGSNRKEDIINKERK